MPNLRQHGQSILEAAVVCAICLGLQSRETVISADDKTKEGKTAVDSVAKTAVGDNDAAITTTIRKIEGDAAKSAIPESNSSRKKARPETAKKKKKGSEKDSATKGKGASNDEDEAPDQELVNKVMRVQDRNTPQLMSQKGVVGTATGLDDDGNVVIRVYTTGADNPQIPAVLEGIPVQSVLSGTIHAWADHPLAKAQTTPSPTSKFARPVPIGVSSMADTSYCAAATLGCRVKDSNGNVYALSCNHVYALENQGIVDSTPASQPSPLDVSCAVISDNDIGKLKAFVKIDFSGGSNTADCAIVGTTTNMVGNATPGNGYGTPSSTTTSAFLRQSLQKYGRTTGLTTGKVAAINVTVLVGYDAGNATFVKQIEAIGSSGSSSLGKSGDSGSLVVDDNGHPVGLLFAGGGRYTFCNPIGDVLQQLGQKLSTPTSTVSVTIDGK